MAKGRFRLSNRSIARLKNTDPRILKIVKRAIYLTKVDFGIPRDGGFRTAERQRELFDQKVSRCDGTHKKSYHQTGRAFDVFAYVDGKASWDEGHLGLIAAAILQAAIDLDIKIEWGGLWNYTDMPHFQLKD